MFETIFTTNTLTIESVLLSIFVSLLLGIAISFLHMKTSRYSKNFVITLAILPTLVELIILMVNGNLGTSVAVLGAFSLIKFRSVPGNSREIMSIFFAMAIGLATGMGQIVLAIVMTIIIGLVIFALSKTNFAEKGKKERILKITIPENLDYTEIFDDIFTKYTTKIDLFHVKTTNMGSMFELSYIVNLKDINDQKKLIDEIRTRNGNLKIILERPLDGNEL